LGAVSQGRPSETTGSYLAAACRRQRKTSPAVTSTHMSPASIWQAVLLRTGSDGISSSARGRPWPLHSPRVADRARAGGMCLSLGGGDLAAPPAKAARAARIRRGVSDSVSSRSSSVVDIDGAGRRWRSSTHKQSLVGTERQRDRLKVGADVEDHSVRRVSWERSANTLDPLVATSATACEGRSTPAFTIARVSGAEAVARLPLSESGSVAGRRRRS
jgi:hypothetical protein